MVNADIDPLRIHGCGDGGGDAGLVHFEKITFQTTVVYSHPASARFDPLRAVG
jgi:hypothetical protein